MYDFMRGVEFVKGIPPNLEGEGYFNPNVRNLLVLDDLMMEAGKDQRITHVYTRGSHHRNLSVITLMQNFFGSGTKTIRRNSHYLVLFDMPADRQEIHTIAQQMFPGNRNCLLHKYEEAVSMPYGHLVIINKPNMLPQDRLLGNPLPANAIKAVSQPTNPQLDTNSQAVNISDSSGGQVKMESSQCNIQPKFHSCDDCGLVYGNMYDLHRHIRKCGEEPVTKKPKIDIDGDQWISLSEEDEDTEDDSELEEDNANNDTLKWMWDEADKDRKKFFKTYKRYLKQAISLTKNKTTHDILDMAEGYVDKGWDEDKAIKMAIHKNKLEFEDLFEENPDLESSEEEEKGEGEDEDEEEEEEEEYI